LVVNDVRVHPVLELNGIFLIYECSVLMVIVQEVMDLRSVEFTGISKGFASYWTHVFLGDSSTIVAQMIDIVLFSVFLQLIQTIFFV
jgi:hypothetical protein